MGEDDEGGGQDGTVVEGHDELITLELPHLVGDGLHLKERVAVEKKRRIFIHPVILIVCPQVTSDSTEPELRRAVALT